MKKLGYLFLALLLGMGMSACSNGDDNDGGQGPKFTLAINVSDVEVFDAKLNVTASDNTTPYYASFITKAEYDRNGGNAAGVAVYVKALLKDILDNSEGKTLQDIVATRSIKGTKTINCDCKSNTDYVAFAFGWNTDGVPTTDIMVLPFKTKAEPVVPGMTVSLGESFSLFYPDYFNSPSVKINTFTYISKEGPTTNRVPYTITYTAGKCTVTYENPYDGAMRVEYVLNADGYPTSAASYYVSDGVKASDVVFTYENKMLTTAVKGTGETAETLFSATYDGANLASINVGGEDASVEKSSINNAFAIDPMFLFLGTSSGDLFSNPYLIAVCCGILPHTEKMPASLAGGAYLITTTVTSGKLVKFEMPDLGFQADYTYVE